LKKTKKGNHENTKSRKRERKASARSEGTRQRVKGARKKKKSTGQETEVRQKEKGERKKKDGIQNQEKEPRPKGND
jgi:hypothetical protein